MMDQLGPTAVSEGVLRKLVVVALLAVGAWAADHWLGGMIGSGPPGLLALGFALLIAFALGQVAVRFRFPAIVGFILAGILLNGSLGDILPSTWSVPPLSWRVLGDPAIDLLSPVEQVAAGLIALTAGGLIRLDVARRTARMIGGVLFGQTVAVFFVVMVWVLVVGLGLPHLTMPGFEGESAATAIGFGAVAAALSLAGSPAATLAVLHGSGAKGPISRLVLHAVAFKELVVLVLFAVTASFVAATPPPHSTVSLPTFVLLTMGGAIALGVVVGVAIALYLRRVRREVPLFILGTVAFTTFAADRIGLSPVAVLLPAGIIAANTASEGEKLVRKMAKISTPLYLVFFMLLGARIRLDDLVAVAPYAGVLVLLRLVALRVGVAAGARATGADALAVRFSWAGFVPQSGIVLPLVALVALTMGAPGRALAALLLACVGINELLGPVLFRFSLGRAGELPASVVRGQPATDQESAEAGTEPAPSTESKRGKPAPVAPWPRTRPVEDPWGKPAKLKSEELNELLHELEADLQALGRDVVSGRFEGFQKDAHAYLRQLRMDLLRHHRRVANRLVTVEEQKESVSSLLRGERADLAERWGGIVLARGARVAIDKWRPTKILEAVDQLAEDTHEHLEVAYESKSFDHPEDESPLQAVRRLGLRARRRWASFTDGTEPSRSVAIGALVRYHLMGKLPARMEGVAALLVDAERQLIDRTRDLFDVVTHGYLTLSQRFPSGGDDPELRAHLAALRRAFEEDIATAIKEVGQIVEDGDIRMACVLGEAQQAIKNEAAIMSTLDLPAFSRRFSRVNNERERAKKRLSQGYAQARQVNAAQYSLLALEFEMGSLEGHIEDAVQTFATEIGRSLDGRAHRQLSRINGALDETIRGFETKFEGDLTGEELAAAIREDTKSLERVVTEANRASLMLRDQIGDEHAVAPLLDGVARSTRTLTDRYRIPSARPARGDWRLPAAVPVVEVPFRQLVHGHIESSVSPNLVQLMRELSVSIQPVAAAIEELDRRISFNVEVAVAEVEEFQSDPVPLETRALVREMIVGVLQRSRARFGTLEEDSTQWGEQARKGVRDAVLGGLEELRWQLVEGRVGALRSRLARTDGQWWLDQARRLPSSAARVRREVGLVVHSALGAERIERGRTYLGLPAPKQDAHLDPNVFARPAGDLDHLPLVYRRLFSAQALEAGDLLVGRAEAIGRARKTLSAEGSHRLRSVALVGPDGVGKGAVANAIVRGVDGVKPESWTLTAPATVEEVDLWFSTPREKRLVVVGGFHWLVSARPGGIEPLRRFVAGVIADEGKNAWLIRTDLLVWRFIASLAPMGDAFPEVVDLEPFDVNQLEAAVLARHAMSGYELAFGPPESTGMAGELGRRLLGRRARQAWFRDLHEASGGLIRDALLLWMSSVQKVDDAESFVWMGKVPNPPAAALRLLPEDVLLTLWQLARNGWTDPETHAALFRTTPRQSAAHLTRLQHWGILVSNEGRFRITVHLRGAVVQVMQDRGWVT
jgi:Kef-type K+ transport system membrane component KefB